MNFSRSDNQIQINFYSWAISLRFKYFSSNVNFIKLAKTEVTLIFFYILILLSRIKMGNRRLLSEKPIVLSTQLVIQMILHRSAINLAFNFNNFFVYFVKKSCFRKLVLLKYR